MGIKFLNKALLFVVLLILLLSGICILSTIPGLKPVIAELTNTTDYIENFPMEEITPAIAKVTTESDATKLIIGDSVCARLFNGFENYNKSYCVVGTNRGIVMSGQYILGELFLETHPDATDIYLVVTTNTMITSYETAYGYQYAVQPFLETDNLDRLDEITFHQMEHAYGAFVTNKAAVQFVDNSPILKKLYLNLLNKYKPIYVLPEIPETVEHYVIKLNELCCSHGVKLHLIPAPLADSGDRRKIDAAIEESYKETGIYDIFPDYFENILYYPPDYFVDGIHPCADESELCVMIYDIQKKNECLEDFELPY